MKQAHPIRLAIIVAALMLSILALQPTKSTDIAITGGNPSSKLTLLSNGSAFQDEFYKLRVEGSGNIGESKNLSISVLDKADNILKKGISIGEGYQAGQSLGGGEIPSFKLSEGKVANGTTYEVSYLVQYMDLGLDLVGGSEIEYRIPMDQMHEKQVELGDIVELFNRKLNNSGLKEIFVQAVGQDRVLVQLPGLKKSEVENIKKVIEQQGNLE